MKKIVLILILALVGALGFSALAAKPKKASATVTYSVSIHCQNCVNKITDHISFLKGVKDLKISLKDKTVTVTYNPEKAKEADFEEAIRKLGYTVEKINSSAGRPAEEI